MRYPVYSKRRHKEGDIVLQYCYVTRAGGKVAELPSLSIINFCLSDIDFLRGAKAYNSRVFVV